MSQQGDSSTADEAVDNDVVLKAVRYGVTEHFWAAERAVGVLGTAQFVVPKRIQRLKLAEARPEISRELEGFFSRVVVLEPSEDELSRAAELEREAQRRSLPVDEGESLLAAIVAERSVELLTTGDKRAVTALQQLLEAVEWLKGVCGRVRSLEQLVLELVLAGGTFDALRQGICADQEADRTLSICFSCYSGGTPDAAAVAEALTSYIDELRRQAQNMLAPAP